MAAKNKINLTKFDLNGKHKMQFTDKLYLMVTAAVKSPQIEPINRVPKRQQPMVKEKGGATSLSTRANN